MNNHSIRIKTADTHGFTTRLGLPAVLRDIAKTGCTWVEVDGERFNIHAAIRKFPPIVRPLPIIKK